MTKAKVVKVYPTQEEIKKIISYDPITGIITNIQTGNILKCEQIGIKNKAYSLSRIILIYYYNYDSTRKIYAKNGILSDLRIDNILFEKEKFSRANVTKEYLNEYFYYDNGELFILKTTVNSGKIGRKIGHLASDGYIYTKIRSISFKLHQLIYIYHNGAIPKGCEIDHGNGVKHDNRIDNLRIGTHAENVQNLRVAPKNNKSKMIGAHKQGTGFQSEIRINKKRIYLGYFDTPEEAHQAYLTAKRIHHPFCTI